jgi:hypothetical protein
MRSATLITLLSFFAQAHAKEVAPNDMSLNDLDMDKFTDALMDKLSDRLIERAVEAFAPLLNTEDNEEDDNADLDSTTLAKPGGVGLQSQIKPLPIAQTVGRRDATAATLGALFAATLPRPAQALTPVDIIKEKPYAKQGIEMRDRAMAPGNMVKASAGDITEVPGVYLRSLNARYKEGKVSYKDTYAKELAPVAVSANQKRAKTPQELQAEKFATDRLASASGGYAKDR